VLNKWNQLLNRNPRTACRYSPCLIIHAAYDQIILVRDETCFVYLSKLRPAWRTAASFFTWSLRPFRSKTMYIWSNNGCHGVNSVMIKQNLYFEAHISLKFNQNLFCAFTLAITQSHSTSKNSIFVRLAPTLWIQEDSWRLVRNSWSSARHASKTFWAVEPKQLFF